MFLDGKIYCNTPEFYRQSTQPGISDKNESCVFSMRKCHDESEFELAIDGKPIENIASVTMRVGRKAGWLNCWSALKIPKKTDELESLIKDIRRMKNEFGENYIFVTPKNSHIMVQRISEAYKNQFECFQVDYKEHPILGISMKTKNSSFSYQREYRFIFDQCNDEEISPKTYYVEKGFRDLAEINYPIKSSAIDENQEKHIFDIT